MSSTDGALRASDARAIARAVARAVARPARRGGPSGPYRRPLVRGAVLALNLLVLSACYTTRLTTAPRLAPGDRVALDVNDQGRTALGDRIGPEIRRLGGTFVGESNGEVELRVTDVTDLNGTRTAWSGETIRLRREHVRDLYARRFSRARTAIAVGVVAAGLVAFIATRGLFGLGGNERGDGGGDGNQT